MAQESLIEYPTDFPIKIMGRREPRLVQTIVEIVQRHSPDFDATTVEMRTSKKNNYLSVTCTVCATSREQLDALYRDLCDHPAIFLVFFGAWDEVLVRVTGYRRTYGPSPLAPRP